LPSQCIAAENVLPLHDAAPQLTVAAANPAHDFASFPSQLFAAHGDDPVSHAVRLPCGAPTTATHVPFEPATSHASHWPSHARSQQRPSTHAPEPHSPAVVQLAPLRLLQVPAFPVAAHVLPASHDEVAQHTPSTQKPVLHELPSLHAVPRSSILVHALPLQ
jgi:hypothetical protein